MKSLDWNKIKETFIDFFTGEWQKKLVALVGATLIWLYVVSLSNTAQTVTLPIQFINLPADMVVMETSDMTATFNIKGSRIKIRKLMQDQAIRPVVDLETAQTGTHDYKIEMRIDEPQSDLVINLEKDRARLKIDRLISRAILIQPNIEGTPPDGFIIDDVFLDIRLATVSGPEEILNNLTVLETKPLNLSGFTNDITTNLGINLPKYVSTAESVKVELKVRIVKKP